MPQSVYLLLLSLFYRVYDASHNCNDPVNQSESSVLTFMRNRAIFIFLFVKIKAFWLMGKICNELNIEDFFIGNSILKYCFVSISILVYLEKNKSSLVCIQVQGMTIEFGLLVKFVKESKILFLLCHFTCFFLTKHSFCMFYFTCFK